MRHTAVVRRRARPPQGVLNAAEVRWWGVCVWSMCTRGQAGDGGHTHSHKPTHTRVTYICKCKRTFNHSKTARRPPARHERDLHLRRLLPRAAHGCVFFVLWFCVWSGLGDRAAPPFPTRPSSPFQRSNQPTNDTDSSSPLNTKQASATCSSSRPSTTVCQTWTGATWGRLPASCGPARTCRCVCVGVCGCGCGCVFICCTRFIHPSSRMYGRVNSPTITL